MDTQPGQVFTPHEEGSNLGQQQQPVPYIPQRPLQQTPQMQAAAPMPEPVANTGLPGMVPSMDAQTVDWQYAQESGMDDPSVQSLPEDVIWTAAEFVEHNKGIGWYGVLALVALVLAVGYYFVTKDYFFTGVIIFTALVFGVYAARKPRSQQYHLSPDGVGVGEKMYGYQNFKNFSIAEDGTIASVVFMPLARFAPPLTIYVSQEVEERVLGYLSLFLPFEQHHTDAIDGLLRRIRF
jgi:hypothetical protein